MASKYFPLGFWDTAEEKIRLLASWGDPTLGCHFHSILLNENEYKMDPCCMGEQSMPDTPGVLRHMKKQGGWTFAQPPAVMYLLFENKFLCLLEELQDALRHLVGLGRVVAKSAWLRFRRWRNLRPLPCSSAPRRTGSAGAPMQERPCCPRLGRA